MTSQDKVHRETSGAKAETPLPLVTLVVLFYNQEAFVSEAVRGALQQQYDNLEIILTDDGSTDETFVCIEKSVREYHGVHRVVVRRNIRNLGLAGHMNEAMKHAHGEIILLAGGDDISWPTRTQHSVEVLQSDPSIMCVSFGSVRFSDEVPDLPEPIEKSGERSMKVYSLEDFICDSQIHTNGACRAIRRSVVDYFGPLNAQVPTEDSTYLLRALLRGKAAQVSTPEVFYRIHGSNLYASPHKHDFDYTAIHEQYCRDVSHCRECGDINRTTEQRLMRALERKLRCRQLRSGFYKTSHPKAFVLLHILPSRYVSKGVKFRYFKDAFIHSSKSGAVS